MIHKCHICLTEKKSNLLRIPGWIYFTYSDGDTFDYCPVHKIEDIITDVIANSWQEIGLYCNVEKITGLRKE